MERQNSEMLDFRYVAAMVIGVCRLISSLALARFSTSSKAKLFSSFLTQAATKCVSASYVLHQVRRTKKSQVRGSDRRE